MPAHDNLGASFFQNASIATLVVRVCSGWNPTLLMPIDRHQMRSVSRQTADLRASAPCELAQRS